MASEKAEKALAQALLCQRLFRRDSPILAAGRTPEPEEGAPSGEDSVAANRGTRVRARRRSQLNPTIARQERSKDLCLKIDFAVQESTELKASRTVSCF